MSASVVNPVEQAVTNLLFKYNHHLFRYINDFMGLKSLPDIATLNVYPNGKEITESAAAFWAAWKYLDFDIGDPDVHLVAVGDGRTPRTGVMFAFRTRWSCISIDPMLKPVYGVKRLTCITSRVEDIDYEFDNVIIAAVHSHAQMPEILKHIRGKTRRAMIAIPCCVAYNHIPPDKEYIDHAIWSPRNTVKIWRNI